jgi:hypothetical protein
MSCGYIVKVGNGTELWEWVKIHDLAILDYSLEQKYWVISDPGSRNPVCIFVYLLYRTISEFLVYKKMEYAYISL